jgi:hypothetical protein
MLSDVLIIYVQFVYTVQLIAICSSQLCIIPSHWGHPKVKLILLQHRLNVEYGVFSHQLGFIRQIIPVP